MAGIPLGKPLFGLQWVLTNAQVELMCADVPVIVTGRDGDISRGSAGKGAKKKDGFKSPSARDINRAAERWKAKHGGGQAKVDINEYQ